MFLGKFSGNKKNFLGTKKTSEEETTFWLDSMTDHISTQIREIEALLLEQESRLPQKLDLKAANDSSRWDVGESESEEQEEVSSPSSPPTPKPPAARVHSPTPKGWN